MYLSTRALLSLLLRSLSPVLVVLVPLSLVEFPTPAGCCWTSSGEMRSVAKISPVGSNVFLASCLGYLPQQCAVQCVLVVTCPSVLCTESLSFTLEWALSRPMSRRSSRRTRETKSAIMVVKKKGTMGTMVTADKQTRGGSSSAKPTTR